MRKTRQTRSGMTMQALAEMPPLFKYLPRRFADALISSGDLRLGTLHDFQDEERHGHAIGDRAEGVAEVYDNPPLLVTGSGTPLSPPVRAALGDDPPPGNVFDRCLFTITERTENRWLYCTSSRCHPSLVGEFGADACVRIRKARRFYRAIFQELANRRLITSMDVLRCVYRDRAWHYEDAGRLPPEAVKPRCYERQQEFRGVFVPTRLPIEPLVLRVPDCAQYCSLVDWDAYKSSA